MVKIMIGLLLGVSISAGTGYVLLPKKMQAEYDKGVADGTKAGTEAGMAAGIVKGRELVKAEYQQEQMKAQAAAKAKKDAQRLEAARTRKAAPAPVQNWHVRGNQLAEPIRDGENAAPSVREEETPA